MRSSTIFRTAFFVLASAGLTANLGCFHPVEDVDVGSARAPNMTFWGSVSALDARAATAAASSVSEKLFAQGLSLLLAGDVAQSEVAFRTLIDDPDPTMHRRARIAVTLSLEAQGKWTELAALPPLTVQQSDSGTIDRAGVESWAGVLRAVPHVEVSAPLDPDLQEVTASAIGTPIITVSVNGHRRHFWLDTGASMSLISADAAIECGVNALSSDTLAVAASNGRVTARPGVISNLSLGAVSFRNLPVAILDPTAMRLDTRLVNGVSAQVEIDGVIGSDVLRRLSVVIDMSEGKVTFARPALRAPSQRRLLWIGYPVLRLKTREGRPVLFGLDTGADSTIVTNSWLDVTPDPQLAEKKASVGALGSQEVVHLPVLRDVTLEDGSRTLHLQNVPIVPERRQIFVKFHGVLGANILGGVVIHMDVTNGIFEIQPATRDNRVKVIIGR